MTFEELKQNENKLVMDLHDHEVLGMFRPIYVGRDRVELMPLKIKVIPADNVNVTAKQITAKITYLLRRFKGVTELKQEVE